MKTNVAAKFLRLIEKHFRKGSKLQKIFSKNSIKVSYACMPNMSARIKSYNKNLLQPTVPDRPCNCRVKDACPMSGKCQAENVVYEARISSGSDERIYIGMSAPPVKTRIANHKSTMRYESRENASELAKFAWSRKREGKSCNIQWAVIDRAKPYNSASKKCHLCTAEKYHILKSVGPSCLNKRTELISKCRHMNKFLIAHFTPIT